MITAKSLAAFTQTLAGIIGQECADVVVSVVNCVASKMANEAMRFSLDALAEKLECTREEALIRLRMADGRFAEAVGTSIIADCEVYDLPEPVQGLTLDLSSGFAQLFQSEDKDLSPNDAPFVGPDLSGMRDIDLLRLSVTSRAHGAFLYRGDSEDLSEEVDYLGRAYKTVVPAHAVEMSSSSRKRIGGGAALNLLSIVLQRLQDHLLIIIDKDLLTNNKPDESSDDDDFQPATTASHPPTLFTSEGERLLRLIPHMPATIIVPIREGERLRSLDAATFVGAIGPVRPDRKSMVTMLQTLDPMVDARNAADLVQLWRDPYSSKETLSRLHRIVGAAASGPAAEALGQAERAPSQNADIFNPLLHRCVKSMFPIVHGRTSPSTRPHRFYRELFVGRPDPQILWDRGPELVQAGAIIGLFGIPGTGKTAAAREAITGGMHLQFLERRGSDLQHRYFGQTEKAIRNAFARARAENLCLLFDEAEAIVATRTEFTGNTGHVVTAMTTQFLQELDDHALPVVFVSNYPERIDPAVRRRIDINIEVLGLSRDLEIRAWELLVGASPPAYWSPLSELTISDFMHASKLARLTDDYEFRSIERNVQTARNARLGRQANKSGVGFLQKQ